MNRKVVTGLTFFLLIILIALLFVFSQSTSSMIQAQEETMEIVQLDYSIDRVNNFYWFTSEETYFSLDYIDAEGNQRYAILAQDGGDIAHFTSSEIISEQDALSITLNENNPSEILQARLGMIDSTPVWEVSFKETDGTLTYYYINGTNGEWFQTIANL